MYVYVCLLTNLTNHRYAPPANKLDAVTEQIAVKLNEYVLRTSQEFSSLTLFESLVSKEVLEGISCPA